MRVIRMSRGVVIRMKWIWASFIHFADDAEDLAVILEEIQFRTEMYEWSVIGAGCARGWWSRL